MNRHQRLHRRSLLLLGLGTAASLPLLGATCSTGSVQQALTDLKNILTSIQNSLPILAPLLGAATIAKIQGYLTQAQALLNALGNAPSGSQIQQIFSYIELILGAIQSVPGLPTSVQTILAAVSVAMAFISSVFGISMPTAAARLRAATAMPLKQAEDILSAAARGTMPG